MMSLARMATFAYYARMKLLNYYQQGSAGAMRWFGRGALAFALSGEVKKKDFLDLSVGMLGSIKLVRNAKAEGRVPGLDVVFTADKTVSATWAVETPDYKVRIEQATLRAGEAALQFLEDNALYTRLGAGGAIVQRASGMFACMVLEKLSRANEPNLHLHCPVFFVVSCRDGRTRASLGISANDPSEDRLGTRSPLYALKKQAGAIFQATLAREMEELGYRMEKAEHGYAVSGVPRELCEKWSSRRKEIVRSMSERGESGARAAARAAKRTRRTKRARPLEELERVWKEDARGFDPASLRSPSRVHAPEELTASPAIHGDESWVTRPTRIEAFGSSKQEKVRERPGEPRPEAHKSLHGGDPGAADDWPEITGDAPNVGHDPRIARLLRKLSRDGSHRLTRANVYLAAKQAEFVKNVRFTKAERQALVSITRDRGAVQYLEVASVGGRVEPLLKAAHLAWKRQGFKVLLTAPTRREALRLKKATGIHSMGALGLLRGLRTNRGILRGIDAAMKKSLSLGANFPARAFVTYALKAAGRWIRFDEKTIVVVTDSLRLRHSERLDLLRRARRCGAKLVFEGAWSRSCLEGRRLASPNLDHTLRVERGGRDR